MSKNNTKVTAFEFDATQVEPQTPFEVIPVDFYNVTVTDGEVKPTNAGDGTIVKLEFTILAGPYEGRKIFANLNVDNPNQQAAEIGQRQLSAICHAVEVMQTRDISDLYNKPLTIKVGYRAERTDDDGKTYEAQNEFKGAKPLDETAGNGVGKQIPASTGAAATKGGGSVAKPVPAWAKGNAAGAPAKTPAKSTATAAAPLPDAPTKPPFAKGAAKAPAVAPAPAKKGPGRPAKPTPAPKEEPAAPERSFFLFIDDAVSDETYTESQIGEMLEQGMPDDTQACLEDTEEWKAVSEFGISAEAEKPAPAPAKKSPPWAKKK